MRFSSYGDNAIPQYFLEKMSLSCRLFLYTEENANRVCEASFAQVEGPGGGRLDFVCKDVGSEIEFPGGQVRRVLDGVGFAGARVPAQRHFVGIGRVVDLGEDTPESNVQSTTPALVKPTFPVLFQAS